MAIALLLSVSVLIMSSYAWMVLSSSPAATGIQVIIGGGNTILIAPNITETADGKNYYYPGRFSDKMNFGTLDSYAYLNEIAGLTPVSTSNGIDWFMPEYYSGSDEEVQSGAVMSGTIKPVSEFSADSELSHANLSPEEKEKISEGSYIYLDFWVVAPGGDYELRVSTGNENPDGGSFVADLPEAVKSEEGYTLSLPEKSAAAAVRIGFLANDSLVMDDTMLKYQKSVFFDERYTALRGLYSEPDSGTAYLASDKFTIYEPNGDYHPENPEINGTYVVTKPLGYDANGVIVETGDLWNNLTVQLSGSWSKEKWTSFEQIFQTSVLAVTGENPTEREITDHFYKTYLQGQISQYYGKGGFVKYTNNLTDSMDADRIDTAGATENTFIVTLERNKPQRIRMFIWLEGQDADCVDGIDVSRFAVNIELAGASIQ